MAGGFSRSRIALAGRLVILGAQIHAALVDLAVAIEPRLYDRPHDRNPRPWFGLVIVGLLICGIAFAGGTGIWAVREAMPHRTARP